jgi:hypothetical protein
MRLSDAAIRPHRTLQLIDARRHVHRFAREFSAIFAGS